jgi:hypothetical protein
MVSSPLMTGDYQRLLPDYSASVERVVPALTGGAPRRAEPTASSPKRSSAGGIDGTLGEELDEQIE